jgi:hypothetical protein
MSVHVAIPTVPPLPMPVELPRVLLEKPAHDATTRAVLCYLEAERGSDAGEHADAFDHLVAICHRAVKPYFLLDRHGKLCLKKTPQFDSISGKRTWRTSRKEGSAHDATRQWIQGWLLTILAPYRSYSQEALTAAVESDEFRYLGRLCRLSLLDTLRSRTAQKNRRPKRFSLDTDNIDTVYSTSSGKGFEYFLACVTDVLRAVVANREELERLDLIDGLLSILGNAEHLERASAQQYAGLVTRSLARRRGVSATSARAYKRKFRETMAQELLAGNSAVRAIFLELPPPPPPAYVYDGVQLDSEDENKVAAQLSRGPDEYEQGSIGKIKHNPPSRMSAK